MTKAIVFDFDGVIVHSEPLHHRAFLQVAQRFEVDFDYDQYLRHYVGFDDRDGFRAMLARAPHPERYPSDDDAFVARLCQEKAEAFESMVTAGIEPVPGILEFIGRVAEQKMPMAIASGATRRDIHLMLNKLGLTQCFGPIVTADDVRQSKPDPTTYQLAVVGLAKHRPELAIAPSDCLAIEDTPAGITAARDAGLMTLGLTTTYERGPLHEADRIICSVEGLDIRQLHEWFG